MSAKLVPTFVDKGCRRVDSAKDLHTAVNPGFLAATFPFK
jgi:hypothetical protein